MASYQRGHGIRTMKDKGISCGWLDRYFLKYYGSATPHFYKWERPDREIIHATRGIQQGDSVSMLLFSIGTFDALQEFRRAYPTSNINAYADDIFALVSKPVTSGKQAFEMIKKLADVFVFTVAKLSLDMMRGIF